MNEALLSDTSPKRRAYVFATRADSARNRMKEKEVAMRHREAVAPLVTVVGRPSCTLTLFPPSSPTAGPPRRRDGLTSANSPRILRGHFPCVWWLSRMCSSVPLCRSV